MSRLYRARQQVVRSARRLTDSARSARATVPTSTFSPDERLVAVGALAGDGQRREVLRGDAGPERHLVGPR